MKSLEFAFEINWPLLNTSFDQLVLWILANLDEMKRAQV